MHTEFTGYGAGINKDIVIPVTVNPMLRTENNFAGRSNQLIFRYKPK